MAGQFHTKPSIAGHQETNAEAGDQSQSPRDFTVVAGAPSCALPSDWLREAVKSALSLPQPLLE